VLRAQAAGIFGKKIHPRAPPPHDLITSRYNSRGERICHLRDTVPPNAQIPHPSFHAIHTLLDPALVPQAVKDHYKDLTRAPELDEFLTHMKKQKGNSAPGPSKFRYSLLLKGPPSLHRLLHLLVCLCLRAEGLPAVLKQALLMPIPKSAGVFALDKMRPITLLEIGYKLTTGWVAQKMRKLHQTAPSPLWDHDQYGGDGGTHSALFRFASAFEDARDFPLQEIWTCLADVQAAFDSVSPEAKCLVYRAGGLPESFINLAFNLDVMARTSVLVPGTAPADPFTVKCGLRQGDPLSVVGWLLFVNPLIKWIKHGLPGQRGPMQYTPAADSEQAKYNGTHTRDDAAPATGAYRLAHGGGEVNPLFYMDDTSFITVSRSALITQLERMSLYLAFFDVHVHPTKTVFACRTPGIPASRPPSPPAVFTANKWSPITHTPSPTPLKYLGVLFDLEGSWKREMNHLRTSASYMTRSLTARAASLAEARYVTGSMIHPASIYHTTVLPISEECIHDIDRTCIRALNRRSGRPSSAAYWQWLAPVTAGGGGYEPLAIKTLHHRRTQFTLWLTDTKQGPEYLALKARLTAHGLAHGLPCSPIFLLPTDDCPRPPPLKTLGTPLTYCEAIYQQCYRYGISHAKIGDEPCTLPPRYRIRPQSEGETILWYELDSIRDPASRKQVHALAKHLHLLYLSDLVRPGSRAFAPLPTLFQRRWPNQRFLIKQTHHVAYALLTQALGDASRPGLLSAESAPCPAPAHGFNPTPYCRSVAPHHLVPPRPPQPPPPPPPGPPPPPRKGRYTPRAAPPPGGGQHSCSRVWG
jgi:hypothetical protein